MKRFALIHGAWLVASARSHARFRRALGDPAGVQRRLLQDTLSRNAATWFGRRHGFDQIGDVHDYRRRVPLSTFDDYVEPVNRIRRGRLGVLTREPVLRLVPSSGSAGARKLVPHTRTLAAELNRAVGPWIADLHRTRPELRRGPAYWSISPAIDAKDSECSKVPIGFDDDSQVLGGLLSGLVRPMLAVPAEVRHIGEVGAFRYATLLYMLRARELRLISVWHPSFLTLLLEPLAEFWDQLLDDIQCGQLNLPRRGDGEARRSPEHAMRPDPRRAAELRTCGPSDARGIWPRLGLISAWGDAHARGALAELTRRFPGVEIQPKGLLGTEGVVTIPFADTRPLAVLSHFFEFLDDDGRPHLAHELCEAGEYAVVLTTGGGLYRYRTGDRVRVDGYLASTPCLSFVGRNDHVSDHFGEKLSDGHAARVLARALAPLEPGVAFAMFAPDDRGTGTGYTLYLETREQPPADLADRLERWLSENPHFRYCVGVGQLAPVRVFRVAGGAHAAYLRRCHREGLRLGDVKPAALSTQCGWSETFEGDYVPTLGGKRGPTAAIPERSAPRRA